MMFLQQTGDSAQDSTSLNCCGSSGVILVVHVVTRQSLCGHTGEVRQKNFSNYFTCSKNASMYRYHHSQERSERQICTVCIYLIPRWPLTPTHITNFLIIQLSFMFCWPCILMYACNETSLRHYLFSIYSVTIPQHVSGLLVAHHQEVTMYICNKWYVLYVLVYCQLAWSSLLIMEN
jgi:hypothetical protein